MTAAVAETAWLTFRWHVASWVDCFMHWRPSAETWWMKQKITTWCPIDAGSYTRSKHDRAVVQMFLVLFMPSVA